MVAFAITIFLSAALLFQVELIIGKELLPWFGGAPSVWTTCLLFFQLVLFLGYAYAHTVIKRLHARFQLIVHLGLVFVSVFVLVLLGLHWPTPITPDAVWKPIGGGEPIGQLLLLLLVSVGLPFFVLSTTGPLLQGWFVSINPAKSPYPLYALSNAGSLIGLVTYPAAVEPFLTIREQSLAWTLAYGVFVLGLVTCVVKVKTTIITPTDSDSPRFSDSSKVSPGDGSRVLWSGLAAAASALLLSTTNHMCQDTAVIPLLWVLPLVLYLLTLMLCFEFENLYKRWLFPPLFGASLIYAIVVMFQGLSAPLLSQIGADAAVLFFGCMICHGELARSKPGSDHLTAFYLAIATGGAIGGLGVAVVAPLLFNGFWEFHASLFAIAALFLVSIFQDKASFYHKNSILVGSVLGLVVLSLGGVLLDRILQSDNDTRFVNRNFFGVLRVVEDSDENDLELLHGRISHGLQYQDSAQSRIPTTYYTEKSGIGLAIENHPWRESGLRIGVIGLGVGTIAAYGRKNDTIQFYEINPAVLKLSKGANPMFTYLKDCPARVDVALGDARLTLEDDLRRGQRRRFDILAVDAFSSDAIPVHLLTKEALDVYRQHIRLPYGIIAFHISNRYLNLVPIVHTLAEQAHLLSTLITVTNEEDGGCISDWILLSSSPAELSLEAIKEAETTWDLADDKPVRLWTDDYSNLLSVLK